MMFIRHRWSLLYPNALCSMNLLNFFSLYQNSSSDNFFLYVAHKIRFIEKMLEILAFWTYFTLAKFDRLARLLELRVAYFYVEFKVIFGNFLRWLSKICIQIKWNCRMKRDSIIHNNYFFRSLITTTGCVFLCSIQWYFW